MSNDTKPPFLRIAASYPPSEDRRLPESVQIEMNVGNVTEDDPVDGEAVDADFTRFVCEIVRSLGDVARRGARQAPTTIVVSEALMTPEVVERLASIVDSHAPGCDGTCGDGPATDPAAGDPDQHAGVSEAAAAETDGGKVDA